MIKMYIVCVYELLEDKRHVYYFMNDPAEAYEKAHGLDAVLRFGRDDDDMYEKTDVPFVVDIENEHGQSVWRECCEARCPSLSNRMFQDGM